MNICALIIQSARTSRVLSVLHWLLLCLILISPATIWGLGAEPAYAQSADSAFAPDVNGTVYAIGKQSDGKIVIAGSFTQVNGQPRSYLARLLPNGALDASLNVTLNGEVKTIKLLPDGSMLLGGGFTQVGGVNRYRIARILPNGQVDSSFAPISESIAYINGTVWAIELQSDNKLLIGGDFSFFYNGANAYSRLIRLNSDGSLDTTFRVAINDSVRTIAIQSTGKLVIGGLFKNINTTSVFRLARLTANGVLDPSWTAQSDGIVHRILVRQDDKLVVVGNFTAIAGASRKRIVQLTADGVFDPGFVGYSEGPNVYTAHLLGNGNILIAGDFVTVNGASHSRIAQLDVTGAIVPDFQAALDGAGYAIGVNADDTMIIGGAFALVNGAARNNVALLSRSGIVDLPFNLQSNGIVYAFSSTPKGETVAGGSFSTMDGQVVNGLARLTPSATVDASFLPTVIGSVYSLLVAPDGTLTVGGAFSKIAGQSYANLVRFDAADTLVSGFTPNPNGPVFSIMRHAGDQLLVAGNFTQIGGASFQHLVRLNRDGVPDATFAPNPSAPVRTLAADVHNGIVVGGAFTTISGHAAGRLARLASDGSHDATFAASANADVYALLVQPDGRIVVGGAFTQINNTPRAYLVRLEADGTLDPSFAPTLTFDAPVYTLALQPDGKLLVGGAFTTAVVDGAPITRNRLARLDAFGNLDMTYDPNANGTVYAIGLLSDGRAMIGGAFTTVGGQAHPFIARLNSDLAAFQQLSASSDGDSLLWTQNGAGPELIAASFEASNDGVTFLPAGSAVRTPLGWKVTGLALAMNQNVWVRAFGQYPSGQSNGSASAYTSVRMVYVRAADVMMTTQVQGGAAQPADWVYTANGKQAAGNATLRIDPGIYTVTYTGPANYTLTSATGACSVTNGVITLNAALGANTCTLMFTRDTGAVTFAAVVEGGAAQPTDFNFTVLTQTVAHNGQAVLETGLYNVTENGPAGYAPRQATGVCALVNGVIQLTVSKTGGTCTVTNTRPVIITKVVEGGNATPADWSFIVADQTISHTGQLLLAPGAYPVTESGPAGYSLVAASGDCALVGGAAQLTVPATSGSTGVCTLTNRRDAGTITFRTTVEGNGAAADSFTYTVLGQNASGNGGQITLPTDDYTVSIAGPPGFAPRLTGDACTLVDGVVRLAVSKAGGDCKITMTRLVKFFNVVEGGTRNPASWSMRVGEQTMLHNRTVLLAPGIYTPTLQGFISTYTLLDARDDCELDALGETVTLTAPGNGLCTLVHRRKTGEITFTRMIQGGDAQPSDWVTMVNGQPMPMGQPVKIDTNTYVVTESGPPDYVVISASGVCTLDRGQIKLVVTTEGGECSLISKRGIGPVGFVINPGGGNAQASAWSFMVNGQIVPHNGALLMPVGLYTVTVQGPAGYTVVSASGICSLTEAGNVQLNVGVEGGTCNLQSAYDAGGVGAIGFFVAPSDDFPPEAWSFVVNSQEVDHNQTLLMPIGTYGVTVNGPFGYHVAGASGACALVDGAVRVTVTVFGGACTVQTTPDAPVDLPFATFLPSVANQ
jgi:uncharacterized delta-60 repeat protein